MSFVRALQGGGSGCCVVIGYHVIPWCIVYLYIYWCCVVFVLVVFLWVILWVVWESVGNLCGGLVMLEECCRRIHWDCLIQFSNTVVALPPTFCIQLHVVCCLVKLAWTVVDAFTIFWVGICFEGGLELMVARSGNSPAWRRFQVRQMLLRICLWIWLRTS